MDRPLNARPCLRRPRPARRRAGAAMLEAVMVLPALAVLLLGVLYLPRLYTTGLGALALARRCALEHAQDGCDDDAVVEACVGLIESRVTAGGESDVLRSTASESIADLPVLSEAIDALFGTRTWATVNATTDGPRPAEATQDRVGLQRDRVRADFHVLCNSTPKSPSELAGSLWDDWGPL